MKNEMFTELLGSAHEALEHAQGKRSLRTTTLPLPPKPLNGRAVKRLRATLHASQAVFARYLNVSTKLVQAWEANRRTPRGLRSCSCTAPPNSPPCSNASGTTPVRGTVDARERPIARSVRWQQRRDPRPIARRKEQGQSWWRLGGGLEIRGCTPVPSVPESFSNSA